MSDPKPQTSAVRTQAPVTSHREHSVPIFATSSFVFDDSEEMRAAFADEIDRNIYSRFTNPNVAELAEKKDLAGPLGEKLKAVLTEFGGVFQATAK